MAKQPSRSSRSKFPAAKTAKSQTKNNTSGIHPFSEYVAAKVITLATLLRRSTAIRYQRMFGMTMVESRVILRVGANGTLSLDQLAAHIAISKSQASRVVSGLVQRGLIERSRDQAQQRSLAIVLSEEGRILDRALIEAAALRNSALTQGIDHAKLDDISKTLDVLVAKARTLLQHDQERSGRSTDNADDADANETDGLTENL